MREMKDSGIEWIGEIPKEWKYIKLKYLFDIGLGLTHTPQYVDDGVPFISVKDISSGVLDKDNLKYISREEFKTFPQGAIPHKGDILFGRVATLGCPVILDEEYDVGMFVSMGKLTNLDDSNVNTVFFKYWMESDLFYKELYRFVSGSAQINLNTTWLKQFNVILPSISEQKKIADFLDGKCTEINALISDIEKQIDTLERYKKSVITEAVTKGLNPDVEMKDSGVEWIGYIPKHWKVEKGKYILKYMQKPTKETDGVITCFRDGEVTLRSNRREDGFTLSDKEIGYQGIDVGDLVVHGMDGFAGAIGISDSRGKASPVLNVLDTNNNKKYIMYYLRSMAYSDVFLALATGIRVRSCDLRWNKLAELPYPIPSLNEQDKIVEYIDHILQKTDMIIIDKKKQLKIVAEYKKSLIYEYVTGKKEVR